MLSFPQKTLSIIADGEGGVQIYENLPTVGTEKPGPLLPHQYWPSQNYPNPFNPLTTIAYSLPARTKMSLKIFDPIGRLAKTLEEGVQAPGAKSMQWDGKNRKGESVSSEIYIYQLRVGDRRLSYDGYSCFVLFIEYCFLLSAGRLTKSLSISFSFQKTKGFDKIKKGSFFL